MNAPTAVIQHTPEDLLAMPDGHRYELLDGQLVERNMGAESSRIAQILNRKIDSFADANHLGLVFGPDCGYQVFGEEGNRVRYADGSFVARGRLPGDRPPPGHMRIAPDLGIEVVSPNDLAWEIEAKTEEWLAAGVCVLWVIYPDTRTVYVYHGRAAPQRLGENDDLSCPDLLPGFTCRVAELFPPRQVTAAPAD